jgi:hypothetical protein
MGAAPQRWFDGGWKASAPWAVAAQGASGSVRRFWVFLSLIYFDLA